MIVVDKDNYEIEVVQSKTPVVVDLWGPKCVPCLNLMDNVTALGDEFEGRVKFCKLNVAENRRLVIGLRVMSVPTFLFYRNGEVEERLTGDDVTIEAIRERAEKLAL